jgi:hypothetical protein
MPDRSSPVRKALTDFRLGWMPRGPIRNASKIPGDFPREDYGHDNIRERKSKGLLILNPRPRHMDD